MTGDTKNTVENKGAATEQVALNKWCHPKMVGSAGGEGRLGCGGCYPMGYAMVASQAVACLASVPRRVSDFSKSFRA